MPTEENIGVGGGGGGLWFGEYGFLYKRKGGGGGRRSTKMAAGGNITCNNSTYLYNKYKPGGGGVGASSISNRRAKNRLATICGAQNSCFPCYTTLGQYSNYTHNPNGYVQCPPSVSIRPSTPTLDSLTPSNGQLTINFTLGSNGGSPVTDIEYSTDGGLTWTSSGRTSSPIIATGLTNGTPYDVAVRAKNAIGTSPSSNVLRGTPGPIVPSAPILVSLTPSNGQLTINFTLGSDGGSSITDIEYSTDNGTTWSSSGQTTSSPIVVSGLTNGVSYQVAVRAINAIGTSPSSNVRSGTPVPIAPSAPILVSLTPSNGELTINFTLGSDGGSAITDVEYSTDNGSTWSSSGQTASSITATGLTNGVSYQVAVRAINAVGTGAASNVLSGTPSTIPSAPTLVSLTPSNNALILNFTLGSDGGSAIDSIEYSTDNGTTWGITLQTTSPLTLSGLTNGNTYQVILKANNAFGTSPESNMLSGIPSTIPSAPTLNSLTPSNGQLTINFTLGSDGGSVITDVEYSTDNGSTWNSSGQTTSPIIATGLDNGVTYDVAVRAINAIGTSTASNVLSGTPSTIPSAPTLDSLTPSNGQLTINFTLGPDGSSAITDIEYSTDNGTTWSSSGQTTSPVTAAGLDNGTTYDVAVRGINANGTGLSSNIISGTPVPIAPSAPTLDSLIPTNNALILNFTLGSDGGSAINFIEYSLDNGANWGISLQTTSPFTFNGLTNGFTYQVILKAINAVGTSPESNMLSGIPTDAVPFPPTLDSLRPLNNALGLIFTLGSDGGTPINDIEYSTDNGTTWSSSGQTASPITATGLTNGTPYNVVIRAVNINGTSASSNVLSGTPNLTIETFTSVGATNWTAPTGVTSVEYLVVGGGGGSGGGFDTGGGGGGGGGMVLTGTLSVTPGTTYNVIVGDGGSGGVSNRGPPASETNGQSGVDTIFDTITALGGGGGYASRNNSGTPSAGGAQVSGSSTASIGGSGGGSAGDGNGAGGGGGGNSSNGSNGVSNVGGNGGSGISDSSSGSSVTYGAGGRGANGNSSSTTNNAVPGAANTGNGARGGGRASGADTNGAKGGSGIVIITF